MTTARNIVVDTYKFVINIYSSLKMEAAGACLRKYTAVLPTRL
jgi:hypothetical protein